MGWIGTGVMGKSMAGHLLKAHGNKPPMTVFNRTASKADDLIANGAKFMTAKEVAEQSDYVFLMLGHPHDVRNMVLDSDNGILNHMKPGSYLIDHTTSKPGLADEIYQHANKKDIFSVDAPVTGGDFGALSGKLCTMTGGDEEHCEHVKPLLLTYSQAVERMGGPGAGQHTKAANQIIIASTMMGNVESLIYGHKAGLDLNKMIQLLMGGSAGNTNLTKVGPKMLKRDFDPGFYVEHFVKDLGIVLDECRALDISLPSTALAHQFYQALVAQGGARMGTHGLLTTLEKFNNT
mmetsp:Transcript_74308/g.103233  ORF Transcript_74308/g.103233 Transcript_74308/m.103233 type:complete len:292 (+) Transcript_74308:35-910(+)|eukprot:CAMPEP_0176350628 /NCGR_PEP_ID=MMETSP0126-20121128/9629_1 /TAXON_ID=141414 ORGANISM="Strombidinopsis acuminatum, Strain SPMC142" /NCGR_SAMPLE_ID=MMETSP0126 /ASSEMBLY_ACC=CAM_ASM_000229 /LENGTH=291 /DNA_ID=CAMNT_0017700757 /DNA_START=33 /DNA_END=908 /DNA_ORIENTATION=+